MVLHELGHAVSNGKHYDEDNSGNVIYSSLCDDITPPYTNNAVMCWGLQEGENRDYISYSHDSLYYTDFYGTTH